MRAKLPGVAATDADLEIIYSAVEREMSSTYFCRFGFLLSNFEMRANLPGVAA